MKNTFVIFLLNIFMLTHVNDYIRQYTYTLIFEETFQNEDGSLKSNADLIKDWEMEDDKSHITSQGRFELIGHVSSKEEYCQYKLEFHMAPYDAEEFGFAIRGGDVSVKVVNGDYDRFYVYAKGKENVGSFPEGFDMSILNKYSVYDNGATASIFVNDVFLIGIDLDEVKEKGSIGFYSTNGFITLDNIDVWEMNIRNPKTRDDFLVLCLIAFVFLSVFFVKIRIDS